MMRYLVCIVPFLMSSCSIVESDEKGEVTAMLASSGVVLNNGLDRTVYVFLVGSNTQHLIDWGPSITSDNAVPGRSSRTFDNQLLDLVADEEDLAVYWWHATVKDGQLVADELNYFVVTR